MLDGVSGEADNKQENVDEDKHLFQSRVVLQEELAEGQTFLDELTRLDAVFQDRAEGLLEVDAFFLELHTEVEEHKIRQVRSVRLRPLLSIHAVTLATR